MTLVIAYLDLLCKLRGLRFISCQLILQAKEYATLGQGTEFG